ncbi:MAG TPA: cupin-like domain-containing protein [Polyangiaceae bacterium]|nr:cupin-like domain-containing protein [Polyangiaceae bacterium]
MAEVERCPPSAVSGHELDRRDTPLVIAGGAAAWPAVGRWTPEHLCELLGPIELTFKSSTSNAHPDFRQQGLARMFARGQAPLREFLRSITVGPEPERARWLFTGDERFLLRRRGGQTSVDPELAPLLTEIVTPSFFPEPQLHTVWAWLSGRGVRTWLHYDNNGCHNLNAQIMGSKRCALYPPSELASLHVFPLGGDNPAYNCSRIDVDQPQPELAGDLARATAWHAELCPGDLLFIPAWWLHTFFHTGELNANVNFWWKPERPIWNAVAARQALVDAAQEAKLDTANTAVATVLGALDAAARRRAEP